MKSLLLFSLPQNVSDLHLSSGENIVIRQNGQLVKMENTTISADDLELQILALLNSEQKERLKQDKHIDFAYYDQTLGRFRCNVFYQQSGIAAVFRVIQSTIYTFEQIMAPEIFKTLCLNHQGLILITGATGSGKSTTLSSFIEYINQTQFKHIITFEDPIEFIYQNKQSLIQQREVGQHCSSIKEGIISSLRQDPDILVIGELRDRQTIEAGLQAAETGHLVFATLHTNSAIGTINRIIDVFADEARPFIRKQLASLLKATIAQKLIYDKHNGRKAMFEVLINTPAVSHLIEEGKIKQIYSVMQTGAQYGMQTMQDD